MMISVFSVIPDSFDLTWIDGSVRNSTKAVNGLVVADGAFWLYNIILHVIDGTFSI